MCAECKGRQSFSDWAARSSGRNSCCPLDRLAIKSDDNGVKTISVNVPDKVYQDLQEYAQQKGRSAEDLVRAAVEMLRFSSKEQPAAGTSALSLKPLDLGKMLPPLTSDDDLLGEMLDGNGH
jgi:hypothetical protein